MSFPVFAEARDSINKAYAAIQNWNTNPANIPLPDVVNTKRPQMSREQKVAAYLKSIEGNPDIDINKAPRMVSRDRSEHDLPVAHFSQKRSMTCNSSMAEVMWERDCYFDSNFYDHKNRVESKSPFKVELVGNDDPSCLCILDTPKFITGSDESLKYVAKHYQDFKSFGGTLDCRHTPGLFEPDGRCGGDYAWAMGCKVADTSPEKRNLQIDKAVSTRFPDTVLLTTQQFNDYMAWRKASGKSNENFSYLLYSDRKNMTQTIVGAIGGGVAALCLLAMGISGFRYRARTAANTTASTITAVPAQALQTVQTAVSTSPANTTAPISNNPTTTTMSATPSGISALPTTAAAKSAGATSQLPSSSSDDDSDSVALDIPPAGHEDD